MYIAMEHGETETETETETGSPLLCQAHDIPNRCLASTIWFDICLVFIWALASRGHVLISPMGVDAQHLRALSYSV